MTIHVVGAGLAGLAAALELADRGDAVIVHEATAAAGGRCRSWFEPRLGRVIDNGAHVVLRGNPAVCRFVERLGTRDKLLATGTAARQLVDLATGRAIAPPSTPRSVALVARLSLARHEATVAPFLAALAPDPRRYMEAICRAALNTPPALASARAFARTLRRAGLLRSADSELMLAAASLDATFIRPALGALHRLGATIRFGHRLLSLRRDTRGRAELVFEDGRIELAARGRAVLAVPPWELARLMPERASASASATSPILNVNFRLAASGLASAVALGLVGASCEWLTWRDGIVTATISHAADWIDRDAASIATQLWPEVAQAIGSAHPQRMPAYRVIKERRATPLQTPAFERARPQSRTTLPGIFLAGDWTATGLPCSIEGAIASGMRAAALLRAAD